MAKLHVYLKSVKLIIVPDISITPSAAKIEHKRNKINELPSSIAMTENIIKHRHGVIVCVHIWPDLYIAKS